MVFYPTIGVVFTSFFKWDGLSLSRDFVGVANYVQIFTQDPIFWRAVFNSGIWVVLSLIVPTAMGLALALALNRPIFGRALFRTIFYLPAVIASIAVAAIWSWMYQPGFGPINVFLRGLGAGTPDWLGSRNLVLFSIFIPSIWMGSGLNMLLFLAGLQGVPGELREAAAIDGAGRLQVFWHVTVPSLKPTFVVVLSLAVVNSLKVFDLIYGMTAGGPGDASQVLASWSYTQAFSYRNFGTGSAIAVVLLAITLIVVVPYVRRSAREE
jgi:raffinose/stachyose/melibiose transport system permease protein